MTEHYRTYGAVMLFLMRDNAGTQELLLQLRQNTGYADGMWDCGASGHVESGESMKAAIIREAREELGVAIGYDDVHFATFTHKSSPDGTAYYNAFFAVRLYGGVPRIMEPDKCGGLNWFPVGALPENMIPDRKAAFLNYTDGIPYAETGWQ